MAVAGVFNALAGELEGKIDLPDPRVQAALLMVSTDIAMRTDTRDMGIIGMPSLPRSELIQRDFSLEFDRNGQQVMTPLDPGDHVVYPCDDCGALPGEPHNMALEH